MHPPEPGKITALLKAWVGGDVAAHEQLIPLVYNELHRLAQYYRRHARPSETLQTTALVHEAYLRLVDIDDVDWQDRAHFFAVSAQLMRRILVDAARARAAAKRGGPQIIIDSLELDAIPAPDSHRAGELVALDDALTALTPVEDRSWSCVFLAGLRSKKPQRRSSFPPRRSCVTGSWPKPGYCVNFHANGHRNGALIERRDLTSV
jgi:RNA polymerase sigma factor (TIGR02999 family)